MQQQRIVPKYIEPEHPLVSKEQKEQMQKEKLPGKPGQPYEGSKTANPLINLQVYSPPPPKSSKPAFAQMNVPDPFAVHSGVSYPQSLLPPILATRPIEIVNNYEINTNPLGVTKIKNIYEDLLPTNPSFGSSNSISDRINTIDYVRNVLLGNEDGQNVTLDGVSEISLMHRIKMLDLNPYSRDRSKLNPYIGLPDGFLLYRSCYPMRYNTSQGVVCARGALGLQLRLYKLTYGQYMLYKGFEKIDKEETFNDKVSKDKVWSELVYYRKILNEVIKQKICPNFISIVGYYISEKCGIDFRKINFFQTVSSKIEDRKLIFEKETRIKRNPTFQDFLKFMGNPEKLKDYLEHNERFEGDKDPLHPTKISNLLGIHINSDDGIKTNPDSYQGQALIILTEGANYNLYGWASKSYVLGDAFNVKRMISTGMHEPKVWESILFQIFAGLYVLESKKIYIPNFSLRDNVFIKDLSTRGPAVSFWKYIIDGIPFYIPNYGYLAQIDLNFKEKPEFKSDKINEYKKIFSNIFGGDFEKQGGMRPNDDIIQIVNNVEKTHTKNYGDVIKKTMMDFLHNRVGTKLKEGEMSLIIRRNPSKDEVKIGNFYVKMEGNDDYRFVIVEKKEDDKLFIFTRNKGEKILSEQTNYNYLYMYQENEVIEQTYEPTELNLSENDLIETYTIS